MSQGGSSKKVPNSLLALSSAAILAVYTAGYSRTRAAADRFAERAEQRRPAATQPRHAAEPVASVQDPAPVVAPTPEAPKRAAPDSAAKTPPRTEAAPETVKAPTVFPVPDPVPAAPVAAAPTPEPVPVVAETKPEPKVETAVAPPAPAAPAAPATPAHPVWKDGTYTGWGYSRHGDLQVAVVIEGGRIISTTIAQCLTRYSCSVIDELIPQPPKRQTPDVDNVSGATQSADAFYYGIVEALGKAK